MPQDPTAAQTIAISPSALYARIDALVDGFLRILPNLAIAALVMTGFFFLARFVRKGIRRATGGHRAEHLGVVLGRLAQAGIVFVGLMVSASIVVPGIGGGDLVQLLGVGGVAIGFAFRDILQNFVAGILILLNQPFRIGDQIVFKDFEGTVENIETRATVVRTYDGVRVLIPNGELFTNAMRVNTAYSARRTEFDVGIGYGDDMEAAQQDFLEAIRRVDGVLDDPAPDVLFQAFDSSDVKLRLRWWSSPTRSDVLKVRSEVLRAIRRVAARHGIDLPFPTQVVLLHDQTDEHDGDRTRQREGWPRRPDERGGNPRPRRPAPQETP